MVTYLRHICIVLIILLKTQPTQLYLIRKRAVDGNGFRPSNKKCLDFCVFTNCNMGRCVLDNNTCFASCVCQENYNGRYCENEIKKQESIILMLSSEDQTATVNDDLILTAISETLNGSISTSVDIMNNRSFVDNMELSTSNSSLLKNDTKSEFPSEFKSRRNAWMECKETCIYESRCVDINGTYSCSNAKPKCAPGFECTHGVCQEGFSENRLTYKCLCEYGWVGALCKEECSKDCGMHGRCIITDKKNGTTGCDCDPNYSGTRCTIKKVTTVENEVTFHWYVIGVCVGIGTVLIIMLILLPYCIWKKRGIFVMKIIHYFQHYEDDDGKTFDAFISYKSSKNDQDFILKQIYPKLELEMGYKLCLHFRDFTPGDVIANNIIRAIEDSRRTILVISQNYIESEWCRMEYQTAQHEMLKMKHKIIPIMLEDISKLKIDKNLKAIINSVTYIEWPGESDSRKLDKFWKQLKLSMPKRQVHIHNDNVSAISSAPTKFADSLFNNSSSLGCNSDSIQPYDSVLENTSNDIVSNYNSSRIRTLLRNPFRLNINSDNFKRLNRTCSKDSGFSSPITASPSSVSPLFNKDLNPLIPRKHVDIRHNHSKGLLSKEYNQTKTGEKRNIYNITCEETNSSELKNASDVCQSLNDQTTAALCFNITRPESDRASVCSEHACQTCVFNQEVNNDCVDSRDHLYKTKCDTCILHNDGVDDNSRQLTIVLNHNQIVNDKVLNTTKYIDLNNRTKTI